MFKLWCEQGIRHKDKWKAKEKFEININKQEPGTKKKIIITISLTAKPLLTNLIFDHTPCQGEYYQRRKPRYVSFLLRNRHRHFSVLGAISFFVSKRQQIAIRWDLARTPSKPRAPVSIGFGLSPQIGRGHTRTLWCTKIDKIMNNCSSCRTHMAIVIVQKKPK